MTGLKAIPNRTNGKWVVIDATETKQAGDFETKQQAEDWITDRKAIDEWTDS